MRHDKLELQLQLMLLLIENHSYTIQDICKRMELSRRNLYYYLEFFRDAGFIVEHVKPYYRISKDSPFFRKLDATVHFTEDEAIAMRQILEQTGDQSLQVNRLKQKLDKLYDLEILNDVQLREQLGRNVSTLYTAVKSKLTVVLKNYSSPHSNTVKDRVVEPFLFMDGNREIRCYELESKMNKTFKLSRIGEVELLDLVWANEGKHKQMFTDVFMFSGEQQMTVTLRLRRLAMQVLCEEYPQAERFVEFSGEQQMTVTLRLRRLAMQVLCEEYPQAERFVEPDGEDHWRVVMPVCSYIGIGRFVEPDGEDHWRVVMPVCSYIGIGRFVLGLFEHIDVLGDDGFKTYLKEKVNLLNNKLK